MAYSFSIEESLIFGWYKTREHSRLLFKIMLTLFALNVAQAMADRVLHDTLLAALAKRVSAEGLAPSTLGL